MGAVLPSLADIPALPVVDIPGVELCSAGNWNDRDYTAAEFRQAVQTAQELGNAYHAPLKLGHADAQLLGQTDGDPAMGWVENLRVEGDKLIGDLKSVPGKLAQLIKSGGYRGRSCEFWLNAQYAGKLRPFMLKAVALLGIDAPAVEGLADITSLYNSRGAALELARTAETTVTLTTRNRRRPSMRIKLARLFRLASDGDGSDGADGADGAVGTDMAGASADDIQGAVYDALAAQFPPAKPDGDDGDGDPGADGPSCNVIDWFLHDSPPYVIVSDQDVDNLFKITFTYDPTSDSATLGSPVPVKGTYTTNDTGEETGEDGDVTDGGDGDGADGMDGMADGEVADELEMARREIADLAMLARSATDLPEMVELAAALPDPSTLTLAGGDGQRLVKTVIAAIDKALSQLGEGASGRPGMGFIRTALSEVKKKLGGMKFPGAQAAPAAKLTRGGRDVNLETLARRLGLPATATEQQVEAKLAKLRGRPVDAEVPATVATLSQTVATLRAERDEERLSRALETAQKQGRLTLPVREEMVALAKSAGVDTAIRVVEKLPVVVDMSERGRDGDNPGTLKGQLSPNALELARKHWGQAHVESLADTRTLAEKRDALQAEMEQKRREARLARRSS